MTSRLKAPRAPVQMVASAVDFVEAAKAVRDNVAAQLDSKLAGMEARVILNVGKALEVEYKSLVESRVADAETAITETQDGRVRGLVGALLGEVRAELQQTVQRHRDEITALREGQAQELAAVRQIYDSKCGALEEHLRAVTTRTKEEAASGIAEVRDGALLGISTTRSLAEEARTKALEWVGALRSETQADFGQAKAVLVQHSKDMADLRGEFKGHAAKLSADISTSQVATRQWLTAEMQKMTDELRDEIAALRQAYQDGLETARQLVAAAPPHQFVVPENAIQINQSTPSVVIPDGAIVATVEAGAVVVPPPRLVEKTFQYDAQGRPAVVTEREITA